MTASREAHRARMASGAAKRLNPESAKPAGPVVLRQAPIRLTLDLDPALHQELAVWVNSAALATGRSRVNMAEALRAMIRLAVADKGVTAELHEQIRRAAA